MPSGWLLTIYPAISWDKAKPEPRLWSKQPMPSNNRGSGCRGSFVVSKLDMVEPSKR